MWMTPVKLPLTDPRIIMVKWICNGVKSEVKNQESGVEPRITPPSNYGQRMTESMENACIQGIFERRSVGQLLAKLLANGPAVESCLCVV
jgi:hypothetical protein